MFYNFFFNFAVYEIMWKDIAGAGRPQMTICCMRIACWIPKATNRFSEYVTLIAFPLQQWLHESASMLRYTCTVCLVSFFNIIILQPTAKVIVGKLKKWVPLAAVRIL